MKTVAFRPANRDDLPFLATAIINAERAHTGIGIWDIALSDFTPDERLSILLKACDEDAVSHFHYSRFLLAVDPDTSQPCAAACAYAYPECGVYKSMPGISAAIVALFDWSEDKAQAIWDRLPFLDDCFPDYEYNNSWMVECVYTDPAYRGQGLSQKILEKLIAQGRTSTTCERFLITCAIGNDPALRLYQRCGLEVVGTGTSDQCQAALGSAGFHLLCMPFSIPAV